SNEDYLIELLTESGLLDEATLEDARHKKKSQDTMLDTVLKLKKVTEEDVAKTLATNCGMDFLDIGKIDIGPDAIEAVDGPTALRFKIVPVVYTGSQLVVAIADPLDFDALDSVRHLLKVDPEFVCAPRGQIQECLMQFYSADMTDEQRKQFDSTAVSVVVGDEGGGGDAPIIRLVHQILQEAYQARASDIHIEPLEEELRVRYRIDGALHKVQSHPSRLLSAVISRIKIMTGSMSIAEKRVPQDGRIQAKMGDGDLDLRVSTVPTSCGESVVMRILDKSSLTLGLPQLGFFSDDEENFNKLIRLPDGILLVTGPTGSGKTTTLYACLNAINKSDRKIITVEDPVEYLLSGINQVQVKESIGMSFAAALRSILRQAPNIIMIGEMRDLETAQIAIQASLTGHLVLSTLHTNDSPGAVTRLVDMGCEPFLVAATLEGVLGQRLLRRICPDCKVAYKPSEAVLSQIGLTMSDIGEKEFYTGQGCDTCNETGYKGRQGLFELLDMTDPLRELITQRSSTVVLKQKAEELGMRTLREDGLRNIFSGITTIEEVLKYT
ncbi:UNVERIFIED_CONTAM: hypothetical protein GTU68_067394, partial [Idotea baltica]|nr:hypothetical protein [Idotea baltica]